MEGLSVFLRGIIERLASLKLRKSLKKLEIQSLNGQRGLRRDREYEYWRLDGVGGKLRSRYFVYLKRSG